MEEARPQKEMAILDVQAEGTPDASGAERPKWNSSLYTCSLGLHETWGLDMTQGEGIRGNTESNTSFTSWFKD